MSPSQITHEEFVVLGQMRNQIDIMASILNEAVKGIRKTRIMYRCNVSYRQLQSYIELLLSMRLLKESKKKNKTIYVTTDKGYAYLDLYRRLKALMSNSEVTEEKSKTKTEFEEAVEIGSISSLHWLGSEIADLKTRVGRLEIVFPKLVFCPSCRKEVKRDFRLCPYCGEKLPSKKVELEQT